MLQSIIIGCVYRHPHANVDSFTYLSDVFKSICLRNKSIFVLGDFNDDLLCTENKLGKIFRNLKLNQMIDRPTRVTPHSRTLLDLTITNKPEMIVHSDVVPETIADHDLISIQIDIKKPKRQSIRKTFRCLKEYNQDYFCDTLLNETTTLNYILNTDNINTQVEIFTNAFNKCLNVCAPILTKEIRRPPNPWITNDIKQVIKLRNKLQKDLKADRYNVTLQEQYKNEKKKVKTLLIKAKKDYYHEKFLSYRGDMKNTWKTVKTIIPNDKSSSKNTVCESRADEFNEFFFF